MYLKKYFCVTVELGVKVVFLVEVRTGPNSHDNKTEVQ